MPSPKPMAIVPLSAVVLVVSAGRRQAAGLKPEFEHRVGHSRLAVELDHIRVGDQALESLSDTRAFDPYRCCCLLAVEAGRRHRPGSGDAAFGCPPRPPDRVQRLGGVTGPLVDA